MSKTNVLSLTKEIPVIDGFDAANPKDVYIGQREITARIAEETEIATIRISGDMTLSKDSVKALLELLEKAEQAYNSIKENM